MAHEVDTNLSRINIRRADRRRIRQERVGTEPVYSTIRRILDTLDSEKKEMAFMMETYRQSSERWKNKYIALRKSVTNLTMDDFATDETPQRTMELIN